MSDRSGSYFELIGDVARKEMEWVGVDPDTADIPTQALHTEAVRRVQVWTLEWLAESLADGDTFKDMFEQLAHGVAGVPDLDLWTGRPGTA